MLRPRIIPSLLIHNQGLVKTTAFAAPKYVGDPINAVRIFNDKEVDELSVFDIDATVAGRPPDYGLIQRLAAECRMPLCYGGGVTTEAQFGEIVSRGVEKVAVSAAAIADPGLVTRAAGMVGGQSVVVVLDVRRGSGGYEVFTHNGRTATGLDGVATARRMAEAGAGELVINSIDRDGAMQGYDGELVAAVRAAVTVPLTILGGCGSLVQMAGLFREHGTIGAAAGSLFVFKGVYRAVLINYPSRADRDTLFAGAHS
jgi:cyclase